MKFIKSYESFNISELKKYAVWNWYNYKDKKHTGYDIIIIEEIIDNEIVWCRDIYTYIDKEDGIEYTNVKGQTSFSIDEYKDCIVYVSDDLNECLEYLKIKVESEKYNL